MVTWKICCHLLAPSMAADLDGAADGDDNVNDVDDKGEKGQGDGGAAADQGVNQGHGPGVVYQLVTPPPAAACKWGIMPYWASRKALRK